MKYWIGITTVSVSLFASWIWFVNGRQFVEEGVGRSPQLLGYNGANPPEFAVKGDAYSLSVSEQDAWVLHTGDIVEWGWFSGNDGYTFEVAGQLEEATGACGDVRNPRIAMWPALRQGEDLFLVKQPIWITQEPGTVTGEFTVRMVSNDAFFYWAGNGRRNYEKRLRLGWQHPPVEAAAVVGLGTKGATCGRVYKLELQNLRPYGLGSFSTQTFIVLTQGLALLLVLGLMARSRRQADSRPESGKSDVA